MGKNTKEKKKEKKKKSNDVLHFLENKSTLKCKSKCCEKYKKKESKRCKRCPMLDLLKKAS